MYINVEGSELDTPIYRFLPFSRLIEVFRTGAFTLMRIDKWDDPFENYIVGVTFKVGGDTLDLGLRHTVHGSCWTRKRASDALWRIYSPDKLAVRISSTPRLLGAALDSALTKHPRAKWFIGGVEYLPQSKIVKSASRLARQILRDRSEAATARSLLFKRLSFAHEDEVRMLVVGRNLPSKAGILKVRLDPHEVVRSVMIDSRTPKEVAEMYETHLRAQLRFRGRVSKSTLYDLPRRLVVQVRD